MSRTPTRPPEMAWLPLDPSSLPTKMASPTTFVRQGVDPGALGRPAGARDANEGAARHRQVPTRHLDLAAFRGRLAQVEGAELAGRPGHRRDAAVVDAGLGLQTRDGVAPVGRLGPVAGLGRVVLPVRVGRGGRRGLRRRENRQGQRRGEDGAPVSTRWTAPFFRRRAAGEHPVYRLMPFCQSGKHLMCRDPWMGWTGGKRGGSAEAGRAAGAARAAAGRPARPTGRGGCAGSRRGGEFRAFFCSLRC